MLSYLTRRKLRHTHIEVDIVDRTKMHEAVLTCIDAFESDKHPVNSLVSW